MQSPSPFSDDYAFIFQQQIHAFREKLDLESKSGTMGEDRISELPNAILCHILSLIPSTKQVVRTSVLSTKWKDIWACVPNLYFNRDEFSSSADFIAFVDRVLLVCDSSAIQKFHLHFNNCHAEDFSRVDGWISTAVNCNVVEVDLSISTPVRSNVEEQEEDDMFELPISLLTCKTLKKLSLRSMIIIKMPTSVSNCFPSLKFLQIQFNVIDPRPTISMDLFHFPVLEYLSIDGDLGYTVLECSISAPELKILSIDLHSPYNLDGPYNIFIDAPKLEKLDHHLVSVLNSNLMNTESLVAANVDLFLPHSVNFIEEDSVSQATEFLAQISVVKHLTLTVSIDQGCSVPLPIFGNLSKLTLHHFGCSHWWRILMELLERSPNLECLEIDDWFYPTRQQMEKEAIRVAEQKRVIRARRKKKVTEPTDREVVVTEPADTEVVVAEPTDRAVVVIDLAKYAKVLNCIPPESVPSCLSSRLKTISIKGFKGNGYFGYLDEMALTKYLLKHAQVLEKLTIYTPGLHRIYTPGRRRRRSTTDQVYYELSVGEMGSNNVEVEIIEEMFYQSEGGQKISIFS